MTTFTFTPPAGHGHRDPAPAGVRASLQRTLSGPPCGRCGVRLVLNAARGFDHLGDDDEPFAHCPGTLLRSVGPGSAA